MEIKTQKLLFNLNMYVLRNCFDPSFFIIIIIILFIYFIHVKFIYLVIFIWWIKKSRVKKKLVGKSRRIV